MDVILLLVIVAVLILFIVGLVQCVRRKDNKLWLGLVVTEFIMILGSRWMMNYYDSLPSDGSFMPYFTEYFICYVASWVFTILLGVSVICYFVIKRNNDQGNS